MLKKFCSLMLAALLTQAALVLPASAAGTNVKKEAERAEKVRAGVARLGTGTDARVRVELRDKSKLEGYVGAAGEDHFVVADARTGAPTRVEYGQVSKVKGNNLSTGAKVGIGVGIGAGVTLLVLYLMYAANER